MILEPSKIFAYKLALLKAHHLQNVEKKEFCIFFLAYLQSDMIIMSVSIKDCFHF